MGSVWTVRASAIPLSHLLIYESPSRPSFRELILAPHCGNMVPIGRLAVLLGLLACLCIALAASTSASANEGGIDSTATTASIGSSTEGSSTQQSQESQESTSSRKGEILKLEREYEKYFAQNDTITKAQWLKGLPGIREKRQMKKAGVIIEVLSADAV